MLLQYASRLRNRSGRSHTMLHPPPPPPRVEAGSTALLLPERLLRRLAICRTDYTSHYFAYNKHKNIDRKKTSIPVSSKQNTHQTSMNTSTLNFTFNSISIDQTQRIKRKESIKLSKISARLYLKIFADGMNVFF